MEYGLSLGSNEGDRLSNLRLTTEKIRLMDDVRLVEQSPAYESEPVDVAPEHREDDFLNSVIIVDSPLEPEQLLEQLQDLEEDMGRPKNHSHNSPRTIDIDIIYAGSTSIDSPELHIPHPRWQERRFVVEPLSSLRPELILPGSDKTTIEILDSLPEEPKVSLLNISS